MKVVRLSVIMIVLFGLGYPATMTALASLLFPHQAKGSIVYDEKGKAVGSEQIGQPFTKDMYFHGRPSSVQYDGAGSGSPNYGPSNQELLKRMEKEAEQWMQKRPGASKHDIPMDLITNSGSGLDPHISPAAAMFQVPIVAKATGLSERELAGLVKQYTEPRVFGIFGEPRVNVLLLNMAVEKRMGERAKSNES